MQLHSCGAFRSRITCDIWRGRVERSEDGANQGSGSRANRGGREVGRGGGVRGTGGGAGGEEADAIYTLRQSVSLRSASDGSHSLCDFKRLPGGTYRFDAKSLGILESRPPRTLHLAPISEYRLSTLWRSHQTLSWFSFSIPIKPQPRQWTKWSNMAGPWPSEASPLTAGQAGRKLRSRRN